MSREAPTEAGMRGAERWAEGVFSRADAVSFSGSGDWGNWRGGGAGESFCLVLEVSTLGGEARSWMHLQWVRAQQSPQVGTMCAMLSS